jgi:choline dehydrogenase-like flavoprotein
MEPYYTQAEQLYQVHGARGEDPTEPPASAPYAFPALAHEPRIQQLSDDLAAAGHHPFHAPCGVLVNEANMPYSTCVRCANCDGFPCPLHAKSDAEVIGVRPALEYPNVTLLTNATAVRLDTNPAGTAVTDVVVDHLGPTNHEACDRLYHQLKSMLGHLGMHPDHLVPRHAYFKTDIPLAGVAHQAGTCRFGTDPATSVLDTNCRAHELDNLYVVDTSFFPSIGAVNPALTAMANALRVGDHLRGRLGNGA